VYGDEQRSVAVIEAAESAGGRDELMVSVWSLPELVETATRCGNAELAGDATKRLAERTTAAGTNLAHGRLNCAVGGRESPAYGRQWLR
jgi:hypothetical protein